MRSIPDSEAFTSEDESRDEEGSTACEEPVRAGRWVGDASSIEGTEHVREEDVHGPDGLVQAHEFGEGDPGRREGAEYAGFGTSIAMLWW